MRSLLFVPGLALLVAVSMSAAPKSADGPAVVVLNKAADEAVLIDPASYVVFATLPTGAGPHEVAISPDGTTAYVSDYGGRDEPGHTITVLDLVDRSVAATWDLGSYTRPHGIVTSADGALVWVTAEGARAVLELDAETGEIERVHRTNQNVSHMVAPTPDETKLYVANIGSGTVSVVDRSSGEVETIETGAGSEGIDVSPDGSEAWVTNREANTISVVDVATDAVVAELESGGEMPIRVRFTPDGEEAWVSNAQSGSVSVFRTDSRERVADLDVGAVPVGILISPDGRRAFVANTRDDRVTVFDVPGRDVIATFEPGDEPDGMAWSPNVPGPRESIGRGSAASRIVGSRPAADPADVASPEAIVTALYDVISGPAGPRDWDRFRSLFVPGALLVPAMPRSGPAAGVPSSLSVDGYIEVAGAQFAQRPFYESETGHIQERFGNVAVRMSGYVSRTEPDAEPFSRGVNAITLVEGETGWSIVSVAWDVEREGNPIPEEYR